MAEAWNLELPAGEYTDQWLQRIQSRAQYDASNDISLIRGGKTWMLNDSLLANFPPQLQNTSIPVI